MASPIRTVGILLTLFAVRSVAAATDPVDNPLPQDEHCVFVTPNPEDDHDRVRVVAVCWIGDDPNPQPTGEQVRLYLSDGETRVVPLDAAIAQLLAPTP